MSKSVAIVTGASPGADRGIAKALGAHGCTVYVTGRSERERAADTIYATANEVTPAGGNGVIAIWRDQDDHRCGSRQIPWYHRCRRKVSVVGARAYGRRASSVLFAQGEMSFTSGRLSMVNRGDGDGS